MLFRSSFFVPFSLISRFEYFLDKEDLKCQKEFGNFGACIEISVNKDEFIKFYDFCKVFLIDEFKFLSIPLFAKDILKDF